MQQHLHMELWVLPLQKMIQTAKMANVPAKTNARTTST